MVRLSSTRDAIAAVGGARDVQACAYTMRDGPMLRALEDAARRGAHVVVRLDGADRPAEDGIARNNRGIVRRLRAAGADAALRRGTHAKSIVADGAAYFDGRNWGEGDFVLRDDGACGVAGTKRDALALEAALLGRASAADGVLVESESFGTGNPVYGALHALARAGASPRLMVSERDLRHNARERAILERLQHDGARVRVCPDSEKFAVAGSRAWIGSANASFALRDAGDLTDWGLTTGDAAVVAAARDRVERRWTAAKPLTAA
ncbi:MAG TPA: hypothetical protein VMF61_11520 [Candidatus Acidoferrales bacterium]|nr:hypothetical protein [Candidatus Acidoferrales bacterium]